MAYTIVPGVIEGDSWTAKDMNKYVRDNFAAGVPDIFTTKGDIAVATGADTAVRVGVGSDDQLLVADSNESTGMKWKTISTVLAYLSSDDYNYGDNDIQKIDTFTEIVDTGNEFSNSTFTPIFAGYYFISVTLLFDESEPGYLRYAPFHVTTYLYKNGEQYSIISYYNKFNKNYAGRCGGSDIVYLDAGDTLDVYLSHHSLYAYMDIKSGITNSFISIRELL
jgi:hypothetical protein